MLSWSLVASVFLHVGGAVSTVYLAPVGSSLPADPAGDAPMLWLTPEQEAPAPTPPPQPPREQPKPEPVQPPPPPPPPDSKRLGVTGGDAASENWIASKQQGEHAGKESEVEQPLLRRSEGQAASPPPSPAATPPAPAAPAAQPTPSAQPALKPTPAEAPATEPKPEPVAETKPAETKPEPKPEPEPKREPPREEAPRTDPKPLPETEKPAENPTEKPSDKPAEKPSDKASDKPSDPSTDTHAKPDAPVTEPPAKPAEDGQKEPLPQPVPQPASAEPPPPATTPPPPTPVSPPTAASPSPQPVESRETFLDLVRPAQPAPNPVLPKPSPPAIRLSVAQADAAWASEKDSDPTSVRRRGEYRFGAVAAGRGVEIYRIVRPQFTNLTRMMGIQRNPTFDIVFNKRGEVVKVHRTRPSGNESLDDNFVSAIHFWRARGDDFDALPDASDATVTIRMTFLLGS